MSPYNIEDTIWDAAKREGRDSLIECARSQVLVTYSDFARELRSVQLDPHGQPLAELLGQISNEANKADGIMLSALVVRYEDGRPGKGFFELARQLDRKFDDPETFWIEEVKRVFAFWTNQE
jgi:hypothetical protein